MGKRLVDIKGKFSIPSGRSILHIAVVEVVLEGIWVGVTQLFESEVVKGIGFLVVFCFGIFAVAWYLPKLSPRLSGASVKNKAEIAPKQTLSWLEQILQEDRDKLSSRIFWRKYRWECRGLIKTEPFLEVIIEVINAAVFPILITGVEGSLTIGDTLCNTSASMQGGSRFPHGHVANLRIRQNLSLETAKVILDIQKNERQLDVYLGSCHFIVQAEEPDQETEPIRVAIGDKQLVSVTDV